MVKKTALVAALWCALSPAVAQSEDKLAFLIPNLYGPNGLVVDSDLAQLGGVPHFAHFNSAFQSEFTQFNIALASQLATLPLPSPASGFTYSFDPALGTFSRSTQSFGPILAERAETIGKKKFTVGFSYQYFGFNSIEGVDLDEVPAVFTHDAFQLGGGRLDVVTTVNSIEATVGQFTAFFSYGLTDRLDASLAVPIVSVDLSVISNATIQRLGTAAAPFTHFFRDATGGFGTQKRFESGGSATGIGDLIVRLKGTAVRRGSTAVALGADVRLPTGDEENFLGLGAAGFKPFAAVSFPARKISPHLNLGYQWNGDSVLAGNVLSGEKGDLPDQVIYAVGADIGVTPQFTLVLDVLGQWVIGSPRLRVGAFTAATGASFPQLTFQEASFNVVNGAVGFKLNAGRNFLVDFNVLFKLNDGGLRDRMTPLLGIEYTF